MTAPRGPGVKSRNRSSWRADRGDVAPRASPRRAGSAPTTARTGRRSSPSRRRRARPAGRRAAGAGAARRSGPGGRRAATAPTDRSRCSPRSAGRVARRAGEARASWRGGCRATRAPRGARRGRVDAAARRHRRRGVEVVSTAAGGRSTVVHAPYAIVRPLMQTSLARRQRHRRALQAPTARRVAARSSVGSRLVVLLLFVLTTLLDGWRPGAIVRRGRLQPLRRRACPTRRPPLDATSSSSSRRSSTTGPARSSSRGSATLKREVVDVRPDPAARWSTRRPRSRTRTSGTNPGFDPVGIVVGRPRHARGPAARRARRSPSSSSGRGSCRPSAFEGTDLRAQDPRDHPVDPPDRGVSRARRASSRSSPPTSTRTSTATRATA